MTMMKKSSHLWRKLKILNFNYTILTLESACGLRDDEKMGSMLYLCETMTNFSQSSPKRPISIENNWRYVNFFLVSFRSSFCLFFKSIKVLVQRQTTVLTKIHMTVELPAKLSNLLIELGVVPLRETLFPSRSPANNFSQRRNYEAWIILCWAWKNFDGENSKSEA